MAMVMGVGGESLVLKQFPSSQPGGWWQVRLVGMGRLSPSLSPSLSNVGPVFARALACENAAWAGWDWGCGGGGYLGGFHQRQASSHPQVPNETRFGN